MKLPNAAPGSKEKRPPGTCGPVTSSSENTLPTGNPEIVSFERKPGAGTVNVTFTDVKYASLAAMRSAKLGELIAHIAQVEMARANLRALLVMAFTFR